MKKSLTIFVLLLFLVSFALAANTTMPNISDVKDKAKVAVGSLDERTENALQRTITLSDFNKTIFGIPQSKLAISELIAYFCFLLVIFVLFLDFGTFIPFLDKTVLDVAFFRLSLKHPFALILTLITATTGTIFSLFKFTESFFASFEFLSFLGSFSSFLLVIIFIILAFILSWISRKITTSRRLENARKMGERVNLVDKSNQIKINASV